MIEKPRRKATPKTLLGRRLKDADFPIVVRRPLWANWFSVSVLPILLVLAAGAAWVAFNAHGELGLLPVLLLIFFAVLLLIAAYTGLDNVGMRVSLDAEGMEIKGLLGTSRILWTEVSYFGTWRGRAVTDDGVFFLGFHQARIFVDGSNNPKRLVRNIFFQGYFLPPFMDLGGKELVKLMRKAGRHFGHEFVDPPSWW